MEAVAGEEVVLVAVGTPTTSQAKVVAEGEVTLAAAAVDTEMRTTATWTGTITGAEEDALEVAVE